MTTLSDALRDADRGVSGHCQTDVSFRYSGNAPMESRDGAFTVAHKGKVGKACSKALRNGDSSAEMEFLRRAEAASVLIKLARMPADIRFGANLILELDRRLTGPEKITFCADMSKFTMLRTTKGEDSTTAIEAPEWKLLLDLAVAIRAIEDFVKKSESPTAGKSSEVIEFNPLMAIGRKPTKKGTPRIISQGVPSAHPNGEGAIPPSVALDAALAKSEAAAKAANDAEKITPPVVTAPITNGENKNPVPRPTNPPVVQNQGKHGKHGKKGK